MLALDPESKEFQFQFNVYVLLAQVFREVHFFPTQTGRIMRNYYVEPPLIGRSENSNIVQLAIRLNYLYWLAE